MSDEKRHLEDEIEGYIGNIEKWADEVESKTFSESKRNVIKRFSRDCKTLVDDLKEADTPSSADLVDFQDRHNSIEVQYNSLMDCD